MDNEKTARDVGRDLVAKIVSSYVKHNNVGANNLPTVIASVHQSLCGLGKPRPVETLTPAVPVRRSVRPDYVVCLECGLHSKILRRHLNVQHGLDPAAYYARWKLPADHPITAPSYSARRSAMAKEFGLGRRRQVAETAPEPKPTPPAKRRRRSRSSTKAASSRARGSV